jgi:hypothetical protein
MTYRADLGRAERYSKAMLGTYRITLTPPEAEPRTAFLRTAACEERDRWLLRKAASDDPWAFERIGARLRYWTARTEADLESTERNKRRGPHDWHVGWPDVERPDSSWGMELNLRQFRQLWGDDPVMKEVFRYRDNWFDQHWNRQEIAAWLGSFHPAGLRFTQQIPLREGGVLRLEGQRISDVTSPCPSGAILTDDPSLPNPPRR